MSDNDSDRDLLVTSRKMTIVKAWQQVAVKKMDSSKSMSLPTAAKTTTSTSSHC